MKKYVYILQINHMTSMAGKEYESFSELILLLLMQIINIMGPVLVPWGIPQDGIKHKSIQQGDNHSDILKPA